MSEEKPFDPSTYRRAVYNVAMYSELRDACLGDVQRAGQYDQYDAAVLEYQKTVNRDEAHRGHEDFPSAKEIAELKEAGKSQAHREISCDGRGWGLGRSG